MTDKPIWEQLAEMGRAAMIDDLPPSAPEFAPRWPGDIGGYTADQMRAAVAKERERIMEELRQALQDDSNTAAIRKGG